ncbi:MAG: hypothetical protein KDB58_09510, partial [Solirubrobacterales bacterium]|nr:hypothetical protein [Solirubrobacterales bacterium]
MYDSESRAETLGRALASVQFPARHVSVLHSRRRRREATMIIFGSAVTDANLYDRCALKGINLAKED